MIKDRPAYQVIIVANGDMIRSRPILELDDTFIIAIDGGYDKCKQLKIVPNLIIGDMDSISEHSHSDKFLHISSQDSTDLEKAILYCKDYSLNDILVLGVCGGEIDHTLNNIMTIAKYIDQENMKFTIYDQYSSDKIKICYFLGEGSMHINCSKNSNISILPLPLAKISTIGLEWELDEAQLSFDAFVSARNRNIKESVQINCFSGKVVIIIDCDLVSFEYQV